MAKTALGFWNVMDFGARGDRQARDDPAIQQAIDTCHQAGGGVVYLPTGDYLAGTIQLKSGVTLQLGAGATIWASVHEADYDAAEIKSLILGEELHDVAIVGRGRIHGQGVEGGRPPFRPFMVYLLRCRNILIENITVEYAPFWTIHLFHCDTAEIRGVTILNNVNRPNTDGIDPNCSRNVSISDCHIVAGDDCIVLKTTQEYPCENITVSNCTLETGAAALKLGTETQGDIRHCTFSNCVIRNTRNGIGLFMKDGSTIEDIIFSNITVETNHGPTKKGEWPIFMSIERRRVDSKVGRIRDVVFSNMIIYTRGRCFIEGAPEQPIENLTFHNVTMKIRGYEDSSEIRKIRGGRSVDKETTTTKYDTIPAYLIFAHVEGLRLHGVQVLLRSPEALEKRSALYGDHLQGVELNGFRGRQTIPGELPAIQLNQCRDVVLRGCSAPEGTGVFLGLTGAETRDIALIANDLSRAKSVLKKAADIGDNALFQAGNRLP